MAINKYIDLKPVASSYFRGRRLYCSSINLSEKNDRKTDNKNENDCKSESISVSNDNNEKVKIGYYLEKGYSNHGKAMWITSKNFQNINVWSLKSKDRSLYKSTINDWFNIANAVKFEKFSIKPIVVYVENIEYAL